MSVFRDDIIRDQVALVTGGGTGIGKEIARTLARHGAKLVIAARRQEVIEAAREEFAGEGFECLAVPCDVRKPDQVEQVVHETLRRYGRLDIVVNNAAGNFPAPMSGISYNGFKAVVDIDLLGTYNVSKAAYEAWLKDHGGNIVNITAPFEQMGPAFQAHVAAAKTGVNSLTRTCAVEWGPKGIRANAVAPGAIADTEGLARFADVKQGEGDGSSAPIGRTGTKFDIANAVLFLVSEAASYVSGQVIYVDGGSGVDSMKMKVG
jgi:peroxisomal 2,4-dienoyl-CoA reductase